MKLLKFTNKWLAKKEIRELLLLFITWRIWITVFAIFGLIFIPLKSPHLLGGGLDVYSTHPVFWGWSNFDGEHYLAIAQRGYRELEHSFFPLYPFLIKAFSGQSLFSINLTGILISNFAFLLAFLFLWRLLRLDLEEKTAKLSLLALVVFPTAFFFGALYTESLFLLLAVGCFLAARKSNWLAAGVLGAAASATRIYGILLFPALLVEWWEQNSKLKMKNSKFIPLFYLSLIPLGLLLYMGFLFETTGSPFTFYRELSIFGEQRSGELVLLYQVFWRYIKMILTVTRTDPIYLTILMEAAVGVGALALIIWGYLKKIRPSYLTFTFLGFILPTLTGSFSSLPRYVLVLFPLFLLLGLFFSERGKLFRLVYFTISITLLAVFTALFIRGYWVA